MPSICSCRKPEPSTSWIVATSTLSAFMCCTKPGPSSSRVPSRTSMLIASIRRRRIARPAFICDQTISLDGFYTRQDYPELLRRIRFKDPESGKTLVFITNNFSLPAATICALYKSRWQVELFFKWIKQHLRIKQFYGTSENAVKTQIWIAVSVYRPRRHRQEAPRPGRLALHFVTDPLGDPLRENAHTSSTCGRRKQMQRFVDITIPIEFIRFLTSLNNPKSQTINMLVVGSRPAPFRAVGAIGSGDRPPGDRSLNRMYGCPVMAEGVEELF